MGQRDINDSPSNRLVHRFFADEFSRDVKIGTENQYKLSVAISEKLLGPVSGDLPEADIAQRIGALVYPSLAMRANSDNVAIIPQLVDQSMRIQSVEYIRIDEAVGDLQYKIAVVDFANSFSPDGSIEWKGRHGRWEQPPGTMIKVAVENGQFVARDMAGNVVERD